MIGEAFTQLLFENLPTLVLGTSSMNTTSSGNCHRRTGGDELEHVLLADESRPSSTTTAGQRPLGSTSGAARRSPPPRRTCWVAHDSFFFELDRRDPLPAGLDQVLGAVDDAYVAVRVDRRHVTGAAASLVGEASVTVVVVSSAPRSTARAPAARRRLPSQGSLRAVAARRSGTRPSEHGRPRRCPQVGPLVACVPVLGAVHDAGGRDHRAGLGHAPGLQDRHAELRSVAPRSAPRHRRAAAEDRAQAARCRGPSSTGSTAIQIVGTPAASVTCSSTIRSASAVADQVRPGTPGSAPEATAAWARPQALAWNIGTTGMIVSRSLRPEGRPSCAHGVQDVERWL